MGQSANVMINCTIMQQSNSIIYPQMKWCGTLFHAENCYSTPNENWRNCTTTDGHNILTAQCSTHGLVRQIHMLRFSPVEENWTKFMLAVFI